MIFFNVLFALLNTTHFLKTARVYMDEDEDYDDCYPLLV